MKCPKCQFDNRGGVNFLEEYGAKIELESPKCGTKIALDRKFCGKCGDNLTIPLAPVAKELSFDEKIDKIQRCGRN